MERKRRREALQMQIVLLLGLPEGYDHTPHEGAQPESGFFAPHGVELTTNKQTPAFATCRLSVETHEARVWLQLKGRTRLLSTSVGSLIVIRHL